MNGFSADTEVFTRRGWRRLSTITPTDYLAFWRDGIARFEQPVDVVIAHYDGEMVHHKCTMIDYLIGPDTPMFCRTEDIKAYHGIAAANRDNLRGYSLRTAEDVLGKRVLHRCASRFVLPSSGVEVFDLRGRVPEADIRSKNGRESRTCFTATAFAEFLGWYLSEGSTCLSRSRTSRSYRIQIAQSSKNQFQCAEIARALNEMGVGWYYAAHQFAFANKALFSFLQRLGLSYQKYIPPECFEWSEALLQKLFTTLILGDGLACANANGTQRLAYKSTSRDLIEGVERLAILLGLNPKIRVNPPDQHRTRYTMETISAADIGQRGGENARVPYSNQVVQIKSRDALVFIRRAGLRPFWCGAAQP